MEYLLMNSDTPVLLFNFDDNYINVMNNDFLPYMLKDYVKTTCLDTQKDISQSFDHIAALKDFFCSRLLNLSRSGAKTILNVANLPQSLKTAERLKISLACRGLAMTDNFWVKRPEENLSYTDVCLRTNPLSNKSFDISILQKNISATRDELKPDLSTVGMFPKFWHRNPNGSVELWKTDRTKGFINTNAEIEVSHMLDNSSISHAKYRREEKDGIIFAVSECFTNDAYSFVSAEDMNDYFVHTGRDMKSEIWELQDFANMVCIDYIMANTDRHYGNFGFMVDNSTNKIVGYAPLFDHNQALIADHMGTDESLSGLIYEPTGLTFKKSIGLFAPKADFTINMDILSENCKKRYTEILQLQKEAPERLAFRENKVDIEADTR